MVSARTLGNDSAVASDDEVDATANDVQEYRGLRGAVKGIGFKGDEEEWFIRRFIWAQDDDDNWSGQWIWTEYDRDSWWEFLDGHMRYDAAGVERAIADRDGGAAPPSLPKYSSGCSNNSWGGLLDFLILSTTREKWLRDSWSTGSGGWTETYKRWLTSPWSAEPGGTHVRRFYTAGSPSITSASTSFFHSSALPAASSVDMQDWSRFAGRRLRG